MNRSLALAVLLLATLHIAALSQTTNNKPTRKRSSKPANRQANRAAAPASAFKPPLADHHMHLLSPAAAQWANENESPLPAIDLPEELARLLRDIAQQWNNKTGLAPLYTEDSLAIRSNTTWTHGRDAVATQLAGVFARPYRVTPVAYNIDGAAGLIAGYFTRGEGQDARHFGHVLLSLQKGRDGVWRIAVETLTFPGPEVRAATTPEQLVAELDAAGIRRGVVLSTAYWFGSPLGKAVEDEYAKVRAENDWTGQQVARFPTRLIAFCSVNPLKDYALAEIERCAKNPSFKGLKLHFGNSGVDVRNPQHVAKLQQVFRAANDHRFPIVAHLWTLDKLYGRDDAEIFLKQILPAAPDITVQIAHMAGGGPGYTDPALAVYAEALAAGDPRTKNLYFDVATVADGQSVEVLQTLAKRIRQIGLQRVLFGSDLAPPPARQSWLTFRTTDPLTDDEFATIANNLAPYLR